MNPKNTLTLLGALALGFNICQAYEPSSQWIKEPEGILPYLVESADFWLGAYDNTRGGFYSEVGLTGNVINNNRKAILIQSRNAYAMAKAFQITGDEKYLSYGHGALEFMYKYGWDEDSGGGWFGEVTGSGSPNSAAPWVNGDKWSFWQHYMLLGINAMIEATQDPIHWDWHEKGNQINEERLWDNTPGREGYYERANHNWSNPRNKGFTPTVDAMTTNATYNYLLTKDSFRRQRLVAVSNNIYDHLYGNMSNASVKATFPSSFSTSWGINTGETTTSIGHFIKTGWCLARAYLLTGDEKYIEGMEAIMDQTWNYEEGTTNSIWNHEKGVPRGHINWSTGNILYTQNNEYADWWSVEQAFTGPMMSWYISEKEEYLQMADQAIEFFMEHYYDYENGEVFSMVDYDGNVIEDTKGQLFKGAYHSVELFYYVYMYGNLFYHKKPVELFYNIVPMDEDREIFFWPIEIEDSRLKITGVTQDGLAITSFDPDARILSVPAGDGGIFKITYENLEASPVTDNVWGLLSGQNQVWTYDAAFGLLYFDRDFYPWSYSLDFGWIYTFSDAPGLAWHYFANLDDILYTGAEWWPFAYSAKELSWVQYGKEESSVWYLFTGEDWVVWE